MKISCSFDSLSLRSEIGNELIREAPPRGLADCRPAEVYPDTGCGKAAYSLWQGHDDGPAT